MDLEVLLKGILIGFSIAAPVGPIGVLCIRRTLARGRASGLVSGLGAATADAIYGSIAGFGLTFVSSFLIGQQRWFRLLGGGFLCYLGVKTFFSRPAERGTPMDGNGLLGDYASTFLLTLTNPLTILLFTGIFAGLGVGSGNYHYLSAVMMVLGVWIGSASWWVILSGGVGMLREKFQAERLLWVNRISGLILVGFGLLAFLYPKT